MFLNEIWYNKFMKKLLIVGAMVGMMLVGASVPVDTYADGLLAQSRNGAETKCDKSLFGMRPWYSGLTIVDAKDRCVVGTPAEDKLAAFTWTIVLNVLFDMFIILGVVSTGFIILGGYWYLRSGGDPVFVARGKKTIQAAVVGTAVALLSTLIVNFITTILTNAS